MVLYVTGAILYFFVVMLVYFSLGMVKGVEQELTEVASIAVVISLTTVFWPIILVGGFLVGVAYLISKKVGKRFTSKIVSDTIAHNKQMRG